MTGRSLITTILSVAIGSGLCAADSQAQADSTGSTTSQPHAKDTKRPLLGPHRFIPNPVTNDPFPRTSVHNSLGIGQALDLEVIPSFVIGTDTIQGVTGDLYFALLDFEYQQRIKDWMGFWVHVKVRGRLGTNVSSLLAEGVALSTGFDIGWILKFLETDRIAMAATVEVNKNDLTGLNLFSFLQGVIDSQPVPLVRKVPTLWGTGGLRFAWAANTWLGLTATGRLSYGESPNRQEGASTASSVAIGASMDFASLIHVPIGVVLGLKVASVDAASESDNSSSHTMVRIAYTGRDDFVVALDLAGTRSTLATGTIVTVGSTRISMRYYF